MPEDTKQLDVRKLYNDLISYTRPEVMDDEDGYDDDDDVAVRQVDEYVKKQKQLVADIKQFIELPSEERHKIVQECREQCAAEGGALFTNRRFARFAAYNIAEKISSLIGSAKSVTSDAKLLDDFVQALDVNRSLDAPKDEQDRLSAAYYVRLFSNGIKAISEEDIKGFVEAGPAVYERLMGAYDNYFRANVAEEVDQILEGKRAALFVSKIERYLAKPDRESFLKSLAGRQVCGPPEYEKQFWTGFYTKRLSDLCKNRQDPVYLAQNIETLFKHNPSYFREVAKQLPKLVGMDGCVQLMAAVKNNGQVREQLADALDIPYSDLSFSDFYEKLGRHGVRSSAIDSQYNYLIRKQGAANEQVADQVDKAYDFYRGFRYQDFKSSIQSKVRVFLESSPEVRREFMQQILPFPNFDYMDANRDIGRRELSQGITLLLQIVKKELG